ncbi:hypothetical protein Drose_06370 [Dactylosporangium roseum]|uniref:Uncharacterized protein n=1 Tax=Dactylosporangium roseum TaxID=47989 RepID=A0ABY5Z8U8_9ACTN|nr:hypothetical protein [Dactylosporangium roseum]UWZ37897.1 hypothetical protein Drose_06370 [Dactylosporangium roseum]
MSAEEHYAAVADRILTGQPVTDPRQGDPMPDPHFPAETPNPGAYHVGRSWTGTTLENNCPCPKAPCGLVDRAHPPACEQHGHTKTIRQSHRAEDCPGVRAQTAPTREVAR